MAKVRYQVLKPVFVNANYIDPAASKTQPVYVMADEGLEGPALKLAPESSRRRKAKDAPEAPAGDNGEPVDVDLPFS